MTSHPTDSAVVQNRRARLRRWIDEHCGGSQVQFIATTADGEKQLNQGELSGLLKSKSFGEKKARSLERQSGMPVGYLDQHAQEQKDLSSRGLKVADVTSDSVVSARKIIWPFQTVTYSRIIALRNALGSRGGAEAMRDIDEVLDVLVTKWERAAARKKSSPR